MNKAFWKATAIRCARSFISVILGAQAGSNLITEIDWKATLILAISTTFWIFLACIMAGLPEVDYVAQDNGYAEDDEDDEDEEENYDDFMGEEADE